MTYSVHIAVDLRAVPDEVRREIVRTMDQIAEAVGTVAPASPFWSSMNDSLLQIDIEGWRVVYRVDPELRQIRVVELHQMRR